MTSPSYRKCEYCDDRDCDHLGASAGEPCYGEVMAEVEAEPGNWIHTCRGHQWVWMNAVGKYLPEGADWRAYYREQP